MLFLQDIATRLTSISLEADEYWSVIQKAADIGIVGGMIYDALLAQCAMKAKAETIYTWNVSHFSRLGLEIAKRVRTP